MIVHIWPDRMAEFSTSGFGDGLSITDPSQQTPENQRVAAMQTDDQRRRERKVGIHIRPLPFHHADDNL